MENLDDLTRILKITQKSVSNISMLQPDALNCVEKIMEKIKIIKANKNLDRLLNSYFFQAGKVRIVKIDGNYIF
jgi:hypothetical protein